MKNKILFLMTLICLFMISTNVNAQTVEFYEAEKIDGIYTKSVRSDVTHFQKSRFFRRKSDNKAAYCIEPFEFFTEDGIYNSSTSANNIDSETWNRMSLIAYYGYGYNNHTDNKWYAITQLMIWQEAEKNNSFYFTDVLNGNKIERFTDEMNEIKNLVSNHLKTPAVKHKTYNFKKGNNYIYDDNGVISNYRNTDNLVTISDNKIDLSNLSEGSYNLTFERIIDEESEPVLFYYSSNSQNLMTRGYLNKDRFTIKVNIYNTEINIVKVEDTTGTQTVRENTQLCGAKFSLYDSNNNLIKNFNLDRDCKATIKDLNLGKYYVKEIEAGKGYVLDDTVHEIELSLDNSKVTYQISNKVIQKEVKLHKDFGDNNELKAEEGIIFDIYSNDSLVDSVKTDESGNASIILDYGKYIFKQKNSTDGYSSIDDFEVIIDENNNNLSFNLVDYLIEVPNTRSDTNNNYVLIEVIILVLFSSLIYVKKSIKN